MAKVYNITNNHWNLVILYFFKNNDDNRQDWYSLKLFIKTKVLQDSPIIDCFLEIVCIWRDGRTQKSYCLQLYSIFDAYKLEMALNINESWSELIQSIINYYKSQLLLIEAIRIISSNLMRLISFPSIMSHISSVVVAS
jgi:hypothetical protein